MGTSAKYNDGLFKLIASITGAYFVTEFGGEDGYFSVARIQSKEFYIEFGSSLVIAIALVWMISWITRLLDRHFDWQQKLIPRIGLQLLLGIVLPAVFDFSMASIYFRIFGMNILDTSYLLYAMPYIVLMITLFNVYYVVYYFYLRMIQAEQLTLELTIPQGHPSNGPQEARGRKMKLKEVFIASQGRKNVSIPIEKICCFFREDEYTFLWTFEKDLLVIRQSLDEIQLALSDKQFFRLNRQIIINYKAFHHFVRAGHGRLKVFLEPATPAKITTVVSQNKAGSFKDWIDR